MTVDFPLFQRMMQAVAKHGFTGQYPSWSYDAAHDVMYAFYRPHHYSEWPLPFFANDNLERWS